MINGLVALAFVCVFVVFVKDAISYFKEIFG